MIIETTKRYILLLDEKEMEGLKKVNSILGKMIKQDKDLIARGESQYTGDLAKLELQRSVIKKIANNEAVLRKELDILYSTIKYIWDILEKDIPSIEFLLNNLTKEKTYL